DPATCRGAWPREYYLGAEEVKDGQAAADQGAVYVIQRNALSARDRKNGMPVWTTVLPAPALIWQIVALPGMLAVFPSGGRSLHLQFRLLFGSLRWSIAPRPEDGQGFPVLLIDPKTGRLVQRLNFDARRAHSDLQCSLQPRWSALPDIEIRQEAGARPVVRIAANRMVVALEGHAWG